MSERRSYFGYEELLACGRGELFGPGNAQLPLPPMLMFDRIAEITEAGGANGKGSVRAEFDIHPELWFFGCHFKGDPVMPACLGLDALWQLTGFFLGWLGLAGQGRALGVGEGGDLGEVGDAEDLALAAKRTHFFADGMGDLAADIGVDFVEDEQANRVLGGERRFHGEHDA